MVQCSYTVTSYVQCHYSTAIYYTSLDITALFKPVHTFLQVDAVPIIINAAEL